jgi:hypothetical protein
MSAEFIAAVLLIVVPIAFNGTFFRLQQLFDYPDILRRPTDEVLRRFHQGGRLLRLTWYLFALSAVAFTPVPIFVHQVFGPAAPWYLAIGTTLGVLAGLMQFLGLIRWSFLVPTLAATYINPESSQSTRDAVAVVFEAFHRYIGVAIGEHLGYLFTTAWTLLLCLAIIETGVVPSIFGWLGIIPAIGILIGVFEETGFKPAGLINALSYVLWSLWLIALGVVILM